MMLPWFKHRSVVLSKAVTDVNCKHGLIIFVPLSYAYTYMLRQLAEIEIFGQLVSDRKIFFAEVTPVYTSI